MGDKLSTCRRQMSNYTLSKYIAVLAAASVAAVAQRSAGGAGGAGGTFHTQSHSITRSFVRLRRRRKEERGEETLCAVRCAE